MTIHVQPWVRQSFGASLLGDARRTLRLLFMISRALLRPSGRLTAVFEKASERQAAYDFVEHEQVDADAVVEAICVGFVRNCAKEPEVLVALDGTSLTLTDREETKGFGSIGSRTKGARGEKVLTTLAMTTSGVPIGPPALVFWERGDQVPAKGRPVSERESRYWRVAVDDVDDRFKRYAPDTKLHFLADREADASPLMLKILDLGHGFTIRSPGTRKVLLGGKRIGIRKALKHAPVLGIAHVEVAGSKTRRERIAKMSVRASTIRVSLAGEQPRSRRVVTLSVVWVHEVGTTPSGEKPLDWLLFTTTPINSLQDAVDVTRRYGLRWRIEDFHRTWKSGDCRVEEMQLRSPPAVKKWASILAVVAARSEHLRHVSRKSPDLPATTAFSDVEIQAVILLKTRQKKRTEVVGDNPTLVQIVRWIADIGGYVGGARARPPGATVISRGLVRVLDAAIVLDELRNRGELR